MAIRNSLIALVLMSPSLAFAQNPTPIVASAPVSNEALARSVAVQTIPLETLRTGVISMLGDAVRLNLAAMPSNGSNERMHPGYTESGVSAAREELKRIYASRVAPGVLDDLTKLYLEHCSGSELADIARFSGSSIGVKLHAAMNDPAKQSSLGASLTATEMSELQQFRSSAAAAKYGAVLSRMKDFSSDVLEKYAALLLPDLIRIADSKAEAFAKSRGNPQR